MKTVVYQSYRTHDVPAWIKCCLQSAREWADRQGFDYRFIDDRLFSYAPDWYRRRVQDNVLLVSDLARLCIARELLGQGYDRAIWVDADVVVFDPAHFGIAVAEEYAFCREVWVYPAADGTPQVDRRVNNSVSVFCQGNSILDFYIHACQMIVSRRTELSVLAVGTHFLTALYAQVPFPVLENVGMFSPAIMVDILRGTDVYLPTYFRESQVPLGAANLCSALRNKMIQGVTMTDDDFALVVEKLLSSRGNVVNRYLDYRPGPG